MEGLCLLLNGASDLLSLTTLRKALSKLHKVRLSEEALDRATVVATQGVATQLVKQLAGRLLQRIEVQDITEVRAQCPVSSE